MRIYKQIIDMPMKLAFPIFGQPPMPRDAARNAFSSASDVDVSSRREGNHTQGTHGYFEA
jgi:hypothetical protein